MNDDDKDHEIVFKQPVSGAKEETQETQIPTSSRKREEKTISDSECIVYSSEKCDFMMEADFFVFNEIEQNATSNKIFEGKAF